MKPAPDGGAPPSQTATCRSVGVLCVCVLVLLRVGAKFQCMHYWNSLIRRNDRFWSEMNEQTASGDSQRRMKLRLTGELHM